MPFYGIGIDLSCNEFPLGLNNVKTLNTCLLSPTMCQSLWPGPGESVEDKNTQSASPGPSLCRGEKTTALIQGQIQLAEWYSRDIHGAFGNYYWRKSYARGHKGSPRGHADWDLRGE